MKELILGALEQTGGQTWLAKQANENPMAFMSLLAKLIPSEAPEPGETIIRIVGGFTDEDRHSDSE